MQTMEKRTSPRTAARKKDTSHESKAIFIRLAPQAQSVERVGNSTNCDNNPIPLKKAKDGTWKAIVTLESGTYEYRFKVDGQWRNDPDCPRRTTNPYGEENCIRE